MIAFDTNILIYSVDESDAPRHETARQTLGWAIGRGRALFPLQVLAEFCNVATRKFKMPPAKAREFVTAWRESSRTAAFDTADLVAAMDGWIAHKLSIWDALIWATCDRVGARILVTEDMQDGRTLGRVTFLDPFNPANAGRLGLA